MDSNSRKGRTRRSSAYLIQKGADLSGVTDGQSRRLREGTDDDTAVTSLEGVDRKEIILFLLWRSAWHNCLKSRKKVLVMLYYENIKLPEIAGWSKLARPSRHENRPARACGLEVRFP